MIKLNQPPVSSHLNILNYQAAFIISFMHERTHIDKVSQHKLVVDMSGGL